VARRTEERLKAITGVSVMGGTAVGVVAIFLFGQGTARWKEKVEIEADFRQVSGLRVGSPVQLEGIEIGAVIDRQFLEVEYPCDQGSEDRGRHGQGRTDACDRTMFCAPEGKCAALEPYTFNKDVYPRCEENAQCREHEVCVTSEFRRRFRGVSWTGPAGVCAAYESVEKRIRVRMQVFRDKLEHIREDSRGVISQNGVLGDQLVQISIGHGKQIEPGGRIQTTPATIEMLDTVKDRFEGSFGKVEDAIGGVAELAKAAGDPETVKNVVAALANANEVTRRTAEGAGLVGTLLNDEGLAKGFGGSVRGVRDTTARVDRFVGGARTGLTDFDATMQPLVDDGRKAMADMHATLADVKDPNSKNKLGKVLYDRDGKMVEDVAATLESVKHITAAIDRGEGSVGRLVKDPKVYDDLREFFQGYSEDRLIQFLIRFVVRRDKPRAGSPNNK
jgi:ABC-type transporter Mla subunit MlaD